jgi:uncharacterized membrane protein
MSNESNKRIEIPAVLEQAFRLFREHASFLVGVSVTYVVLAIIPSVYQNFFGPTEESFGATLFSVLLSVLNMVMTMGVIKISLALIDQKPTHVGDMFSTWYGLLHYFLATMTFVLIIVIGLSFLIFPGIYLALRLQFYSYFIVEEPEITFWEALNKSYHLTENWTLALFWWALVNIVINLLGVLFFFVGVIISYPITQLVTASIYRGMQREAESIPDTIDYQRMEALESLNGS